MIHGVALFIVLASPVIAWSQAPDVTTEEVLTVEHAVELAFTQNRQVKNAALDVEKAGDDIAAARTRRWPSLNFSIRGIHNFTSESYTIKAGQLGASPAADTHSRVFNIEVTVPNPKQVLKAGMIVSLGVSANKPQQPATVVPISAIMRARTQSDQYAVFVVEEHNGASVARLRTVEIGNIHGNTIAITAGLKAREQIIVTGTTLVSEGEVVRIIP